MPNRVERPNYHFRMHVNGAQTNNELSFIQQLKFYFHNVNNNDDDNHIDHWGEL